ncbi:phage portal protein [Isoptericola halotolerans]|uniref:phage portal protein n=1 Tax=Isoptericola halotolerans TaxID=300560 RepID=UPI00388F4A42
MTMVLEDSEARSIDAEMTTAAQAAMWDSWGRRCDDRAALLRFRDYAAGKGGIPDVADGASEEIKTLAQQSVMNVCGVVVDTFDRSLSVTGFRSPSSADDEAAWEWWQRHGLDASQHRVHRGVQTYGYSYASVLPDADGEPTPALWSPLDVIAEYDDPERDLFPTSAMLVRPVRDGWSVLLVDDATVTPGRLRKAPKDADGRVGGVRARDVEITGEPWEHEATYGGKQVCPVVRFENELPVEGRPPRGEVEPIIDRQRAINSVNFDRLCLSRFSAFQQKVVLGWTADKGTLQRASTSSVWTFEEGPGEVDVKAIPASPLAPYNELLREQKEQVALEAGIPLYGITGSIANVSTETVAIVEAAHQRKLAIKRELLGERWEQVLRLAAEMAGRPAPADTAEVVWRETEARSFGAVVDGITKLAAIPDSANGVPVGELLDLIPGMTQRKVDSIRQTITRQRARINIGAAARLASAEARAQAAEPVLTGAEE